MGHPIPLQIIPVEGWLPNIRWHPLLVHPANGDGREMLIRAKEFIQQVGDWPAASSNRSHMSQRFSRAWQRACRVERHVNAICFQDARMLVTAAGIWQQ